MTITKSSATPNPGVVERKIARKNIADMTGFDSAAVFTVTGDVFVRAWGVVGATQLTCTSGTTTLSLGTSANTTELLGASTIDGAQFDVGDVWGDTTPSKDVEALGGGNYRLIGNGADIVLTRNVDDITAGELNLYVEWFPASDGATIVAA